MRSKNRIDNGVPLPKHICAPESYDRVSCIAHVFVPYPIAHVVYVLTAINLNNQVLLTAEKVCEIGTNRKLPNELVSAKTLGLQLAPHSGFGVIVSLTQ